MTLKRDRMRQEEPQMTDIELADRIAKVHPSQDYFTCTEEERQQIIAALRRGPEHPPLGEMVMVPREPTDAIVWAICEHSDAPIDRERCLRCPAKEPTYYGEGTRGCRALAEDQFRAALSAAEASKEAK